MKKLGIVSLVLLLLVLFVAVFGYINQDKLVERFIIRQSSIANLRTQLLDRDGTIRLVSVGTGSPIPGRRNLSCNAVFVNGKFFLFDIGDGGASAIERLRLPLTEIEGIFITHWHADHFFDLPEIINRSWVRGREHNITVYGPEPIDSIMYGLNMFVATENQFRVDHHGDELMDFSKAKPIVKKIDLVNSDRMVVYDRDGVIITAFKVRHEPATPAFGYKIEFQDKSLVISGDTKKDDILIEMSRDADILLHEALSFDFIERAQKIQEDLGVARNARILADIMDYHTSPVEAAEIAESANVKKLILTHLGPAPENPISRTFYTSGMDDVYNGTILLAEDGDLFTIE